MALSEEQIVRYSRQILLPNVGGKGQEKLLAAAVAVTGEGSAQWVAAAYLAAGGAPLQGNDSTVAPGETGFLFDSDDVGRPLAPALRSALLDANPDACREGSAPGCLAELPASFSGAGPWVGLGYSGERGALIFRSASGCQACFEKARQGLAKGPQGEGSVLLGALGALMLQRLALGMGPELGGLWVEPDGQLVSMELTCGHASRPQP